MPWKIKDDLFGFEHVIKILDGARIICCHRHVGIDVQNPGEMVERTRREFESIINQHNEVQRMRDAARDVSWLLKLGDQRLLVSDGPCGGQNAATALSADESAKLYQACCRIAGEPTEE